MGFSFGKALFVSRNYLALFDPSSNEFSLMFGRPEILFDLLHRRIDGLIGIGAEHPKGIFCASQTPTPRTLPAVTSTNSPMAVASVMVIDTRR